MVYQKKKKNSRVSSLKSNCGPGDMKKKREEHGKKKKVLCVLCLVLFNAATSGKKRCSHAKSKKKEKKPLKKHANAESSAAFGPSYIITKHEATEREKSS